MSLRDRPIAVWAFPVVMLVGSLLLLGSDAGQVAMRLRGILFDAYQHAQPRPYQETLSRAGFSVRVLIGVEQDSAQSHRDLARVAAQQEERAHKHDDGKCPNGDRSIAKAH